MKTKWEDIKKDFINSGVSSKSKTIAIRRPAKGYIVGFVEVIVDRWGRERWDAALIEEAFGRRKIMKV
jgi:hypothetical protein